MHHYHHSRYAGNFADVVKHTVVVALLSSLQNSSRPFYVYDTHAGRGVYPLNRTDAGEKNSYSQGIERLWTDHAGLPGPGPVCDRQGLIEQYLQIIRDYNPGGQLGIYPGSPAIIQHMLRRDDRLCLTELDEEEFSALQGHFQPDRRIETHQQDAFTGLEVFLPPGYRHGMVLIDPPYTENAEYQQVVDGLHKASKRWPGGMIVIWYPLVSLHKQRVFLQACAACSSHALLHLQFQLQAGSHQREQFTGCGLLLVNAPAQFDRQMVGVLDYLAEKLVPGGSASTSIDWLAAGRHFQCKEDSRKNG